MSHFKLVAAAAVSALAVAAPTGLAASAGNGGGPGSTTSPAAVSASPDPAAANGTRVYLSGCGYEFRVARVKVTHSAGYVEEFDWGMGSNGCLVSGYFLTREAGTYSIDVLQSQKSQRKSYVLKASTSLTVS